VSVKLRTNQAVRFGSVRSCSARVAVGMTPKASGQSVHDTSYIKCVPRRERDESDPTKVTLSPHDKSDATCRFESDAERSKWIRLSGYPKRYKQNVHRTAHYPGGKFKFENECGLRKQNKFVVSSVLTEYVGHFAEFLQTANFVVHYRANRISSRQKLNMDGTNWRFFNTHGTTKFTNSIKPKLHLLLLLLLLLFLPSRGPQDAHTLSKGNAAHQMRLHVQNVSENVILHPRA